LVFGKWQTKGKETDSVHHSVTSPQIQSNWSCANCTNTSWKPEQKYLREYRTAQEITQNMLTIAVKELLVSSSLSGPRHASLSREALTLLGQPSLRKVIAVLVKIYTLYNTKRPRYLFSDFHVPKNRHVLLSSWKHRNSR